MGLITTEVTIQLFTGRVSYYKNKGYRLPTKENGKYDLGASFTVKIKDLPLNSHEMVECTCDFCNKPLKMKYQDYIKQMQGILKKVCCVQCKHNKSKLTNLEKYQVENPLQCQEIRNKQIRTCIHRYGVPYYVISDEFKDKSKSTMFKKYGVEWASQNQLVKEKKKQTSLIHYGCEYPMQSPIIRDMIKKTMNERYGVSNPLQSELIRKKMSETYYKNQSVCTSIQQKYICQLYDMELNYPILYLNVDMYNKENDLCCEYDGGGHFLSVKLGRMTQKDFDHKEMVREILIRNDGHKIMRIISRHDNIPSDTILLQMLSDAKQYFSDFKQHSWITFDIDEGIVKNAEYQRSYFYGELRKIKKSDLESA